MSQKSSGKNLNRVFFLSTVVGILLLLLFSASALAHPPRSLDLSYDGARGILQVKISHRVGNPSRHYVERITVTKNDTTVVEKNYQEQESRSGETYEYRLEAKNGDLVEVEATCNRFGKLSESLQVEGVAPQNRALLEARLTTGNEVPEVKADTPDSASGLVVASLDREENILRYAVAYKGLSGRPTMAHFHQGAQGETGPPVRTIFAGSKNGEATEESQFGTADFLTGEWGRNGSQPLTEKIEKAILNGEIYLNIHTELNPGGEIRAQLIRVE